MAKKQKYYVVWEGREIGVFRSWSECEAQVLNFPGAKYKAFDTEQDAVEAFQNGHEDYVRMKSGRSDVTKMLPDYRNLASGGPDLESLAVDAACSGNPGKMEYRGVYLRSREEVFHMGPLEQGTNNIGEFLAIVHGLALMKQKGLSLPIYSDSANAISWIKQKKCKTKLVRTDKNEPIFDLITRAEKWLRENNYSSPVYKWETRDWGEIPADFGRK
ncbi:MAG: viroplasmin family protein [Paludibacteraceae bacterium]|jgi:Predicted double-stranded RNA/RNA-DNA hybrid binding protein|nr:viroplasmin family protein [Paludibacteraceae bacterium]